MMSWLKPSDLNGEKFFFGQSVQGIHNGIRNNGFLHQAHWGADTNGATNLNDYLEDDVDVQDWLDSLVVPINSKLHPDLSTQYKEKKGEMNNWAGHGV